MGRSQPRIAILAIEGTNCDEELRVALASLGTRPEIVPVGQLERDRGAGSVHFDDFAALFVPGGFAAGDYVRAGAILAARVRASRGPELEEFVRSGRIVAGICNGFQVLIELGLLPGRPDGALGPPEAALVANDSGHYECRPTYVAWEGGNFAPLSALPPGHRFMFPSGHGEGKLVLAGGPDRRRALEANGQLLFRWVTPDGGPGVYPWNPNGSEGNVAGLTNPSGNVFGLMPHPERAFFRAQTPDWTRHGSPKGFGDGHRFLARVVRHIRENG